MDGWPASDRATAMRIVLRTMAHLRRDETAPKMGHPSVVGGFDVGHPSCRRNRQLGGCQFTFGLTLCYGSINVMIFQGIPSSIGLSSETASASTVLFDSFTFLTIKIMACFGIATRSPTFGVRISITTPYCD